jgi:hypothetical protein
VEKSWARQTRRRQVADQASSRSVAPVRYQAARASASTRTSATARFMPLAPVGGTMWAASPARNSRPKRIGSTTKLRMPVTPLSRIGPSSRVQPSSVASRAWSSSQIRPSGQSSIGSSGSTWRYSRVSSGERMLCRAKPRSEEAYTISSLEGATAASTPSQANG